MAVVGLAAAQLPWWAASGCRCPGWLLQQQRLGQWKLILQHSHCVTDLTADILAGVDLVDATCTKPQEHGQVPGPALAESIQGRHCHVA